MTAKEAEQNGNARTRLGAGSDRAVARRAAAGEGLQGEGEIGASRRIDALSISGVDSRTRWGGKHNENMQRMRDVQEKQIKAIAREVSARDLIASQGLNCERAVAI